MILTTDDQQRRSFLERKRRAVVDAMNKVAGRFVGQVAEELPERWEHIVREFIKHHPYEATAQGKDGLAQLKAELRQLQTRADVIAKRHLGRPDMWKHGEVRVAGAIDKAEAQVLPLLEPLVAERGEPWLKWEHGRLSQPLEQMLDAYDHLGRELDSVEGEIRDLDRQLAIQEAEELWDIA